MTAIQYRKGDATQPGGEGHRIIVHICNDIGGWGRGFVLALSARWKEPENAYREWYQNQTETFGLGHIQLIQVEPTLWVANLIGQHDVKASPKGPPIRYDAVLSGLQRVALEAKKLNASVHMPRIGCGLAGGSWENIEPLVNKALIDHGIAVTVYDFESRR